MSSGLIQDTKRALVTPPFTQVDNFETVFRRFYGQLSQQVQTINNSFRQFRVTVAPAAVTATATFATLGIANYPDGLYGVFATPTWGTTVAVTAISATAVTFAFGTASPGGGGTLLVITCR